MPRDFRQTFLLQCEISCGYYKITYKIIANKNVINLPVGCNLSGLNHVSVKIKTPINTKAS